MIASGLAMIRSTSSYLDLASQPDAGPQTWNDLCYHSSGVKRIMQDHLRRASQVSSALEGQLRQEGRAEAQAQAEAHIQALKQSRAEAQTAAEKQIQALLQERDDLQVTQLLRPIC